LFGDNASSNNLQTVNGGLHCLLALEEPFHRILVDKMEDVREGPSSSKIMHEVSIFKGSGTMDGFPSWSRHAMRQFLVVFTMGTVSPIIGDMFQL
jgi:hypothetical protein